MAHMACKNAISNIYFELGEFHELCDCFFSVLVEPHFLTKKDAQQIWLNLVLYCAAMFTIYSISIPNGVSEFILECYRESDASIDSVHFCEFNAFLLVLRRITMCINI